MLDEMTGTLTSGGRSWRDGDVEVSNWREREGRADPKLRSAYDRAPDSGGASRFFFRADYKDGE